MSHVNATIYAPLQNKCRAATIRKAWRDVVTPTANAAKAKEHMLKYADQLWNS